MAEEIKLELVLKSASFGGVGLEATELM